MAMSPVRLPQTCRRRTKLDRADIGHSSAPMNTNEWVHSHSELIQVPSTTLYKSSRESEYMYGLTVLYRTVR